MAVEYRIISIGTLSRNVFWGEREAVRTAHATTTLVISGDRKILVDPSLPAPVLNARLNERTGLQISDVAMVFLTTFRAAHRGGLSGFERAKWFIHATEKAAAKRQLEEIYRRAPGGNERPEGDASDERAMVARDLELLNRCETVPDRLADQVSIFPSPGVSAGCCGLLLTPPVGTTVITGDAIVNVEYLERGQVWDHSVDLAQAQQSLRDILEVADVIVPGHDNLIPLLGKLL